MQFCDASLRAQSFDKSTNTIEVIWTTGATVTKRGRDGYYDEELIVSANAVRLARLNAGASFLDTHRDGSVSSIIGSVIPGSARIADGRGLAKIALSPAPSDADTVLKIKEGVIRNISVGYAIHRVEIVERDGAMPIYSVVDWEPFELSAVAVPADPGAQVRGVRSSGASETSLVPCRAMVLTHDSMEWRRINVRAIRRQMMDNLRRAMPPHERLANPGDVSGHDFGTC
ncbi:hypothetical protein A8B73_15575 [Methylosinus sp. 3S-1]|nr:hypothetical protein A8B73_15575 [Methylosinus sp. 3S-1]